MNRTLLRLIIKQNENNEKWREIVGSGECASVRMSFPCVCHTCAYYVLNGMKKMGKKNFMVTYVGQLQHTHTHPYSSQQKLNTIIIKCKRRSGDDVVIIIFILNLFLCFVCFLFFVHSLKQRQRAIAIYYDVLCRNYQNNTIKRYAIVWIWSILVRTTFNDNCHTHSTHRCTVLSSAEGTKYVFQNGKYLEHTRIHCAAQQLETNCNSLTSHALRMLNGMGMEKLR